MKQRTRTRYITHDQEDDLEQQVLEIKTKLEVLQQVVDIFGSTPDVTIMQQINTTKNEIRREIKRLQSRGINMIDIFAKFGSALYKSQILQGKDYLDTLRKKNQSDQVSDLINEDAEVYMQNYKRRIRPRIYNPSEQLSVSQVDDDDLSSNDVDVSQDYSQAPQPPLMSPRPYRMSQMDRYHQNRPDSFASEIDNFFRMIERQLPSEEEIKQQRHGLRDQSVMTLRSSVKPSIEDKKSESSDEFMMRLPSQVRRQSLPPQLPADEEAKRSGLHQPQSRNAPTWLLSKSSDDVPVQRDDPILSLDEAYIANTTQQEIDFHVQGLINDGNDIIRRINDNYDELNNDQVDNLFEFANLTKQVFNLKREAIDTQQFVEYISAYLLQVDKIEGIKILDKDGYLQLVNRIITDLNSLSDQGDMNAIIAIVKNDIFQLVEDINNTAQVLTVSQQKRDDERDNPSQLQQSVNSSYLHREERKYYMDAARDLNQIVQNIYQTQTSSLDENAQLLHDLKFRSIGEKMYLVTNYDLIESHEQVEYIDAFLRGIINGYDQSMIVVLDSARQDLIDLLANRVTQRATGEHITAAVQNVQDAVRRNQRPQQDDQIEEEQKKPQADAVMKSVRTRSKSPLRDVNAQLNQTIEQQIRQQDFAGAEINLVVGLQNFKLSRRKDYDKNTPFTNPSIARRLIVDLATNSQRNDILLALQEIPDKKITVQVADQLLALLKQL